MMHFRLQYSMSLWNIKIQITYEFLYLMIVKNLFNSQQCLNGSKVKCHSQTLQESNLPCTAGWFFWKFLINWPDQMTWTFIFHRQIRAKQKIETALLVISKRNSIFKTVSIVGEHKRRISFLECNFSIRSCKPRKIALLFGAYKFNHRFWLN